MCEACGDVPVEIISIPVDGVEGIHDLVRATVAKMVFLMVLYRIDKSPIGVIASAVGTAMFLDSVVDAVMDDTCT